MTFTINFGWWVVPLLVTLAALFMAWRNDSPDTYIINSGYSRAVVALFIWVPAIIVSLIAWLIWAVLT